MEPRRDFTDESKISIQNILADYGELWSRMVLPFVAFDPDTIRKHAHDMKLRAQRLAEAI